MCKKFLTFFLAVLLLNVQLFAQTKAEKKAAQEAMRVEQIKATVNGYGTGESALVAVKRKNNKAVKGYISAIHADSFVVADTAAASSFEIPYQEVTKIKPYKLPTANRKFAITMTAIIIGAVVLGIWSYKHCQKRERAGNPCPIDENTY